MKNLTNFWYWLILSIFLVGCSSEMDNEILEESSQEEIINKDLVLQKLLNMGFDPEKIEAGDDFYLVEGDLMFSKNVDDYKVNDHKGDKQANTNNLVSQINVSSITVFIDQSIPTFGTDNWRNAISSAINDWNSVASSKVNFTLVTSANADIVIRSDSNSPLPASTIASAGFPTNNNPYNTILINLDYTQRGVFNFSVPEASKRYNMVHELGHCIGFRHTNWQSEGSGSAGANQIPGTPTTDSKSVMNGGTADFLWNGFSNYDIIATRYLYPATPSLTVNISGPTRAGNAGTYTWTANVQNGSGTYTYTWYYNYDNSSNYVNGWGQGKSVTQSMPYDKNLSVKVYVKSNGTTVGTATRFTINSDLR